MLVQNSTQDAKAIQTAIADIKAMCIADREYFAQMATETLIEIEYKPFVHLPLERPLWSEPIGTTLNFDMLLNESSEESEAIHLNERSALACWQLEERVNALLQERASFPLPELVEAYPPEFELEELVGYLAVGMKNQQHLIERDEPITFNEFLLPQVTFQRPLQSSSEKNDV